MSIETEWTNKDTLSVNDTTESPEWKRRSRILYIDFNEFEKATTVNPDEVLVIKTTPEYAQYLTQRLKDELNTGKPVVVMLAKDMDAYVVKKDNLKVEAEEAKPLKTDDAQEVKHGKWVEYEKGIVVTSYRCSICGRVVGDDTGRDVAKDYPYCFCGAKMEAEVTL